MATIIKDTNSFFTIMQLVNPNYCFPEKSESNR